MLGYAFVDGFTRAPRHEAIERMKSAIVTAGGVIVDFAFGEGAVRLNVEIEAGAVCRLADALEENGVQLFDRCAAELAKAREVVPSHKPVTAMLHVTLLDERDVASVEAHGPHSV